jgi:hypothetical protein
MKKLLLMALFTTLAFSQYNDGNTVVTWSKYKWEPIGENPDISWMDRDADVAAYQLARHKVSRQLMSSMMLTHFWTGESEDVAILGEFRNMKDATDYAGFNNINDMAWRNADERATALSNYNRHFQSYHEDVHILEHWKALEKKNTAALTGEETINNGNVVSVSIRYWKRMSEVEGGSSADRLAVMKKYADEVVKKNDKIVSQKVLTHLWSGSIEGGILPVFYITEYTSLEDMAAAGNAALEDAAFGAKNRGDYWKYFHDIWDNHTDLGIFKTFAPANK